MEIRSLDGISGPGGECHCDHCQMDHNIDSLMPANRNLMEVNDATPIVAVVAQVGE